VRDHTKLRAFELAEEVALIICAETRAFPSDEKFGLVAQMRRAAVSVGSNIVEGCARKTHDDHVRFLCIAHGSAREREFQAGLSVKLGFPIPQTLMDKCVELSKALNGLISSLSA
jgi:four helix bundle protein